MRTRIALLAAAFVLLGASSLSAQAHRSDQEVGAARVIDHGFGFELTRLSPQWRLGGETIARRIVVEAVAAAFDDRAGTFVAVLVEPSGEATLENMAQFMVDGLPVTDKQVERFETLTYLGHPAVRFVVTGVVDGISLRFGNTFVARGGFIYQVACVGLRDLTPEGPAAFEALWNTFSFRAADSIPGRSLIQPVTEAAGVGWQLVDGGFLSAAFGLAAQPTRLVWHAVVGDELRAMNEWAEVGLMSESPPITVLAIPERVTGLDEAALEAGLERRFSEELVGASPFRQLTVDFAGTPVQFDLYELVEAGEPMDFLHGTIRHGEFATQLVAWWESASRTAVLEELPAGLRQLQFLDEAGRQTLAARLTVVYPQTAVGAGWSLRGGVFTDFTYDLSWTKPTGFWEIRGGQAARDAFPGARLAFHAESFGVHGVLRIRREADVDGREWFGAALAELVPADHPALGEEPVARTLSGQEAYEIWFDRTIEGMAYRHLLITTVAGDRVIDLLVWGAAPIVRTYAEVVYAAVDGLSIAQDNRLAVMISAGHYIDNRLGFSLAPPASDWAVSVLTPPHLSRRGAVVQVAPDADHGVVVFALGATDETEEVVWFEEIAEELGLASLRRAAGISLGAATETTFRGHPAERVSGRLADGTEIGERYTFHHDGIVYQVAAFSLDGAGPSPAELLEAFQFIDEEGSR